ncbi:MAG: phosphopantetheine-binding protein [Patescibacteria group bacterium]|nr:phosphopantetheine-binding protein [Patescibacteria group bacterium]
MDNDTTTSSVESKVKKSLASYLGIEVEDISLDDTLRDDLHMLPTDLTDFLEQLSEGGLPIDQLDIMQIKTVGELVDFLKSEEYLE